MSSKTLNIAIILTAYDKATRIINEATSKAEKRLKDLKKSSMDSMGKGLAQIGAGIAIAAPLIAATDAAIKFEDKMADVGKVMNITIGSDAFKKISDQAQDLSFYLGKTPADAAALMEALSAGGVAANDLDKVAKIAGEMGVAFGMAQEQAGQSFVKIKNALGATIPETEKVADAINHLSNLMASEAPEIVNFMASGGSSVAAAFKIAGKDAAAFGSTLISLGKSSSESATIMERFAKGIFKNDGMRKIFEQAGGGAAGLVAVLEKANKNKTGAFDFFQRNKFGEYSSDFALLAKNIDQVGTALGYVSDETKYAASVNSEFKNRTETTAFKIAQLKSSLTNIAINLGQTFLPAVSKAAKLIADVANSIRDWVRENPRLAKSLGFAAAAVAGVLLLAGAFNVVKGALIALKVVALTNPVILIIMAIAIIAGVLIANWDKVGPFFKAMWNNIKNTFMLAWTVIKNSLLYIFGPAVLIYKNWDKVATYFTGVWDKVKDVFNKFWEWVKALPEKFFQAGVNIVNAIGEGIEAAANKAIDKVKQLAKDIRDFFPFSPAKRGPLMDIHKIKLVETIAANIKAAPMVNAVNNVARSTMGAIGGGGLTPAMAGGGATINYSPTINISGAGPQAKLEFEQLLKTHADTLMQIIKRQTDKKARTSY